MNSVHEKEKTENLDPPALPTRRAGPAEKYFLFRNELRGTCSTRAVDSQSKYK